MIQLILHLIGDYVTQSDWMAQNKTKQSLPAFCHAVVYSLPFLLIGSCAAWVVIMSTHFLIDRFRLARYVVYGKNFLAPKFWCKSGEAITTLWWRPWAECSATGYHDTAPAWLAVWLMIAADNTLHLAINYCSLKWL